MARASYAVWALLLVPLLALLVGRAITHPWDQEIILDEFVRKETSVSADAEIQTATYLQKNVKLPLGPSTWQCTQQPCVEGTNPSPIRTPVVPLVPVP